MRAIYRNDPIFGVACHLRGKVAAGSLRGCAIVAGHRDVSAKAEATLESLPSSSALSARSNTVTPPIQ
jgi:hypothetical protein